MLLSNEECNPSEQKKGVNLSKNQIIEVLPSTQLN
jgi:hypothetical protein